MSAAVGLKRIGTPPAASDGLDLASVDGRSSPDRKIALFRTLFRGREDVYPRRFESVSSGRSGYAPACANEWLPGVCGKPRVKCAECPNRGFLPVTDDEIRWHLSGADDRGKPFVMGVYPMLLDETCHFLAVDFDGPTWSDDALAYLDACAALDVPAALERSRSGAGGHVWIFFEQAVVAGLARRLGASLLTDAMDQRPDLGFRSYDRFFPSQDTLPRGGFGNLIALPLQRGPRRAGNSVFVDGSLEAFPDQWGFLAALCAEGRTTQAHAQAIVSAAERKGRILGVRAVAEDDAFAKSPWLAPPSRQQAEPPVVGPFPRSMELTLGDRVYIAKTGLPPALITRLMRLSAFQNPEFYRAQAMRLPTYGKPRIIDCVEDGPIYLGLPRGCLEEAEKMLRGLGIETSTEDRRCLGRPLNATFRGRLRPAQEIAARALATHDTGVLAAATAFGKTVVAAWLIAERGVNTLVVVHREQLLDQWVARLSEFLGLGDQRIGRLSGRQKKLSGTVDVALMQSLVRKGEVDDRIADYGFLIVDECHHVPARSFELVTSRAKAKYVTGLTATVTRKDGHHPIVFLHCGPVRHRAERPMRDTDQSFSRRLIVRPTGFRPDGDPDSDPRAEFQRLCTLLTVDSARNAAICRDVAADVRDGRSPLVLTERVGHLDALAGLLAEAGLDVVTLRGGMGRKALAAAFARLDGAREAQVVVATGRFVGEGLDQPHLDTLFLTMPVSWRGTVIQYVGRLHRLHEGKVEVRVYDYVDFDVPMLARMFDKRCRAYEAEGYAVERPGGAVPGWPADVSLPANERWKQRFQASVSRLARDGIEADTAGLFFQLADAVATDDPDAHRVRSASEAFLLRRLQDTPGARDRFRANAQLPIPFGDHGMEVDFLDEDARLVIELDGPQHLANADAYRRDRRKDALLQEHGYLVLRFLAEDLGTRFCDVLDDILRAIANRTRSGGGA